MPAAMAKSDAWRIGVAGLGTVGAGLLRLIDERPCFAPVGREVVVTGVSARSRSRPRPVNISNLPWFDDPVALAASPDNDIFVELIGGSDGPAKVAVETALKAGKPVVTANKALIAEHGAELALLAEANRAPLLFEAAVMGGTPAVKMLREAMVGDEVEQVAGILNGTCNYILTEMEATGRAFADVLAEAQRLGYAEADPTMDVGGFDAAHKISILAALAFGCAPTYAAAEIEGVEAIEPIDIRMAKQPRLPHQAGGERGEGGRRRRGQRAPCADAARPPAGADRRPAQRPLHPRQEDRPHLHPGSGRRRGADCGRRRRRHRRRDDRRGAAGVPAAGHPAEAVRAGWMRAANSERAYIRLLVRDEPGVIAAVSETLAEAGVSIDSFLQKPVEDVGGVPIVLTTHAAPQETLAEAVRRMAGLAALIEPPRMIRIARI